MAFVTTKDTEAARTWVYENTNDADPEFERRCKSLAELLTKVRDEGAAASFDASQRAFGL